MKLLTPAALATACLFVPPSASAQEPPPLTTVSIGLDYAEGDYGTPEKTATISMPVAIKHENGRWTFRASIPYVWTEGTFSREAGVPLDVSGRQDATQVQVTTTKQEQSGVGDLTLGVFYNVLETRSGLLVDTGVKAKLATADKANTLITSGESDYSVQVDVLQSLSRSFSVFGTLGWTKKGDSATINYQDPLYGSLGGSLSFGEAGTLGAAWDFREKTTAAGDPVSEVTAFYTFRLPGNRRLQVYVVEGLSDGSPDSGIGAVLSQRF